MSCTSKSARLAIVACVAALGCSSPPARQPAPMPVAADQEPPADATYAVPLDVERLLDDDAGFARFARALRADIEQRLARGGSPTDQRKTDVFDLAILDALGGDWDRAVHRIEEVIALEQDPAMRLMAGLTIRVWAQARRAGGEPAAAFGTALDEAIAAMPYDVVRDQLDVLRNMGQVFTRDTCKALVASAIGPDARDGVIGRSNASALVFQRYAVLYLAPVGPQIVDSVARAASAR